MLLERQRPVAVAVELGLRLRLLAVDRRLRAVGLGRREARHMARRGRRTTQAGDARPAARRVAARVRAVGRTIFGARRQRSCSAAAAGCGGRCSCGKRALRNALHEWGARMPGSTRRRIRRGRRAGAASSRSRNRRSTSPRMRSRASSARRPTSSRTPGGCWQRWAEVFPGPRCVLSIRQIPQVLAIFLGRDISMPTWDSFLCSKRAVAGHAWIPVDS